MPNEFSSLLDIVLAKGIRHSEILGKIHDRILSEYKRHYPKAPISTEPVIEEATGKVHLVNQGKDMTPADFRQDAESIARQVLIEYISSTETVSVLKSAPQIPLSQYSISSFLFWIYNVLFSIYNFFLGLAFIPYLFSLVADPISRGNISQIQSTNVIAGLVLLLIPYFSLAVAVRSKLYRKPHLLGKILIWGELPMVILTIPLLFIQSIPPSVGLIWLCSLSLPLVLVTAEEPSAESRWGLLIRTLGFLVTVYLSLIFLFFMPLVVSAIFGSVISAISSVFQPQYGSPYLYGGMPPSIYPTFSISSAIILLLSIFGLAGGLLLVIVPFALPLLLGILVNKTCQAVEKTHGVATARIVSGIPIIIVALFFISSFLPLRGSSLLTTVSTFDEADTFQKKMEKATQLSGKAKEVENQMKAWAALSRQYPLRDGDTWLSRGYQNTLHFPEPLAKGIESLFYTVASPFVYHAGTINEQKIYTNYQAVYGVPFGTQQNPTTGTTAKNVTIVTRKIAATASPASLFAMVTYEEEYRNETSQEQEVIYEFSLPPDAVITDLDLGPNLEFQGQISPRGAARRTYQQQVTRRRDPALIEQVGPRQYRLRVFPIPSRSDRTTLEGRNQKVRFTYTTPISWEGIPLPRFSKKQNMTELNLKQTAQLNGRDVTVEAEKNVIPELSQRLAYCNGQITFPSFTLQDTAFVLSADDKNSVCSGQDTFLTSYEDQKMALVVDISAGNTQSLTGNLTKLFKDNSAIFRGGMIDLYYANDSGISDPIHLDANGVFPAPISYFGLPPTLTVLQQISAQYTSVILLTGGTQPIHSDAKDERGVQLKQPVFIYHVYGQIPTYPDDVTSSLLTSGGMVVDSLADAYYRTPLRRNGNELIKNGWFTLRGTPIVPKPTPTQKTTASLPEKVSSVSPEEALAAKYSIYASIQRYQGGDIWSDIPQLDTLNAIAGVSRIVSPFSSSLALVSTLQEQQLRQQEQQSGRYETDQAPLPTPQPILPVFNERSTIMNPLMNDSVSLSMPLGGINSFSGKSGGGMSPSIGTLSSPASFQSSNIMGSRMSSSSLLGIFVLVNIVIFIIAIILSIPKMLLKLRKTPKQK